MTSSPLTVHMVGNAHLDPVWLWHWPRGSDEAIATCRAACDLLDEYPDAVFTRGEAWVYEQVRQFDPDTFRRIRRHVESGRWDVIGGWWVQADTNLPTETALRKQIELGHRWFREHLGVSEFPVAYLPDSFGHGAYLPKILVEAGQQFFTFMRPNPQEKELPGPLFRWSSPDGHEILCFRIIKAYALGADAPAVDQQMRTRLDAVLASAPSFTGHVMAFYGVGDHGGGPTRAMVEWILGHRDYAPGVRLEFSTPARFFAAVDKYRSQCPAVRGDLAPHAIGCYSVCGRLKRDLRRAELDLVDAEALAARYPASGADDQRARQAELTAAWETVCFNQFHDILPGSAIRPAIETARAQINAAGVVADRITHHILRGASGIAGGCRLDGQRLHVVNRLDRPWSGLAECDVWVEGDRGRLALRDAAGRLIPVQKSPPQVLGLAGEYPCVNLVFPLDLAPGETRSFQIVREDVSVESSAPAPVFQDSALDNGLIRAELGRRGISQLHDRARGEGWAMLAAPLVFECIEDFSDTWSHGILGFAGIVLRLVEFEDPLVVETGPWRATARMLGALGSSRIALFATLHRGERILRLRLDVSYREPATVFKAAVKPHFGIRRQEHRVAGGWIERALDSLEYPVHHATRLENRVLNPIGIVTPDSFASDCGGTVCRPTLLRNSYHAYDHWRSDVDPAGHPRVVERFGTDEGPHTMNLAVALGEAATRESLERILDQYQRPPWFWDDYRGGKRLAAYER